jgi:AAA+ ATPase superfamily predicted ATPase
MAFYGRGAELGKLDEMYRSGVFEFAVVYGRRNYSLGNRTAN